MDDLASELGAWGVIANRIHTEIFGSSPPKTPGIAAAPRRPHAPAGPAGVGPLVSFARSGLNVRWAPAFQNLLELAEACDVPVRWSCRTGVWHSCETGLIIGAVGYRPEPVEPPADGNALICCCQPQSDIGIVAYVASKHAVIASENQGNKAHEFLKSIHGGPPITLGLIAPAGAHGAFYYRVDNAP